MPLQKIDTLFKTSPELKRLSARARRLRELQTIYVTSAPRELARASQVRNFRGGTLFISAYNAAVAAKLRQLAPTVLESIRKTVAEVTALRIDVQVGGAGFERQPRSRKVMPGQGALEALEALGERMPDGGLKDALSRLVDRQRRSRRA